MRAARLCALAAISLTCNGDRSEDITTGRQPTSFVHDTQICWLHDVVRHRCHMQIYCDEVVQQSERARMNINGRKMEMLIGSISKDPHRHISCFVVRRLIEWQHSRCLGFMCPVIWSGQITLMLWSPMLHHIFISWSSWIEQVLQSEICFSSTQR